MTSRTRQKVRQLAANIRAHRVAAGLTQAGLAQLTGLYQSVICRKECGRNGIGLDDLVVIAAALGIEPADLLRRPRRGRGGSR